MKDHILCFLQWKDKYIVDNYSSSGLELHIMVQTGHFEQGCIRAHVSVKVYHFNRIIIKENNEPLNIARVQIHSELRWDVPYTGEASNLVLRIN